MEGSAVKDERFVSISANAIKETLDNMTPVATRKKVDWAIRLFRNWHQWKNEANILSEDELSVYNDIDDISEGDLNIVLQKFIFEVRKKDHSQYPPKTVYDIFAMINYYVQNNLKRSWSLFKDSEFQQSRKCLEAAMKSAASNGLTSGNNRSNAISLDEEDRLWRSDVFGKSSPKQITQTVVYLIGIHFCLRGGKELRRLRYGENTQIMQIIDSDGKECLVYKEDISKCRQGGFSSLLIFHSSLLIGHSSLLIGHSRLNIAGKRNRFVKINFHELSPL